jgi:hypothetical protein
MVTDLFGTLLQELGPLLEIPTLHPDRQNSCLIRLKGGLNIQLELDRMGQFFIMGSDLGTVPPGKYRENLFREALKANGMPQPLNGILAYSQKTEHLILFEKMHVKDLNGDKIMAVLTPFCEKARVWRDALARGDIPALTQYYASGKPGGIFGLTR